MNERADFIRDHSTSDALAASNHRSASKIANEMTLQGMMLLAGIGADTVDFRTVDGDYGTIHVADSGFLMMTSKQLQTLLILAAVVVTDDFVVCSLGSSDLDRHPPDMQEAPDGR